MDQQNMPVDPPEHLDLSAELAAAQNAARRLRVAYECGLPLALAERLVGDTDVELAQDAARLTGLLKPATPGVPPAPATMSPPRADLLSLSPEEVRKHKKELMGR